MTVGARKSLDEPVDLDKVEMRARKSYRWPKGVSGNPAGGRRNGKAVEGIYREVRRICINVSPEMAQGLIDLAKNAEDERVRSVCLLAVLDRAGIRPIDKPETDLEGKPAFDLTRYSIEEQDRIREVLLLLVDPERARMEAEMRSRPLYLPTPGVEGEEG